MFKNIRRLPSYNLEHPNIINMWWTRVLNFEYLILDIVNQDTSIAGIEGKYSFGIKYADREAYEHDWS